MSGTPIKFSQGGLYFKFLAQEILIAASASSLPRCMSRCLVFARSLRGRHVGSAGGLRGLVFAATPWCAVGLTEGSHKIPVHPFVSGSLIASMAGGHLG